MTVAVTPEQVARLKREQKARRDRGHRRAAAQRARGQRARSALGAAAALRAKDGATLDPYRACLGLAAAAAERARCCSSGRR